jgi:hypothetical protein
MLFSDYKLRHEKFMDRREKIDASGCKWELQREFLLMANKSKNEETTEW